MILCVQTTLQDQRHSYETVIGQQTFVLSDLTSCQESSLDLYSLASEYLQPQFTFF